MRLAVCCCFFGCPLSSDKNLVDDRNILAKLRPPGRTSAPVARRHREPHHLVDGLGINPEASCRCSLAQPLDLNGVANLRVELHLLHPPPSAESGTGLPTAGILLRRNRPT